MSSDLKEAVDPVRWYPLCQLSLGLPSKRDIRTAIDKLSEMESCHYAVRPDNRWDTGHQARTPVLAKEVKQILKRRWSPF
jgi:hypothetical protein